jgi:6-phospho-3-hexuloisomerase
MEGQRHTEGGISLSVITDTCSAAAFPVTAKSVTRSLLLVQDETQRTTPGIDPLQIAHLAEELRRGKRVFVTGAGRSGLVMKMAAMRLMHLGLIVHVVGETTAPAIGPGDVLLAASGSGTTSAVVKAAQTASAHGARVAVYTTNPGSPLAQGASAVVVIPAAQKTDYGSTVSRQYSGSLFEQVLLTVTEAVFHSLWDEEAAGAEDLWLRHANLE